MKKTSTAIALFAIIFILAGCQLYKTQNAPASPPGVINMGPSATNKPVVLPLVTGDTVTIGHFIFEPAELTAKVGDTVTWKHDDSVTHTIVSLGLFESPVLSRGGVFSFTFNKAGTYDYYCSIHPSMRGKIIVQ